MFDAAPDGEANDPFEVDERNSIIVCSLAERCRSDHGIDPEPERRSFVGVDESQKVLALWTVGSVTMTADDRQVSAKITQRVNPYLEAFLHPERVAAASGCGIRTPEAMRAGGPAKRGGAL